MSLQQLCLFGISGLPVADIGFPRPPLTRTSLDCSDVVFGHVVLDPRPIRVALSLGPRVGVQLLREDPVAEQARRHSYLEGQPVLRLSDVEHISAFLSVEGSCCLLGGRGDLVYAVQAVLMLATCVGGAEAGGYDLPSFSSVLSISSLEMPKPSQYPICNSISRKTCVTTEADCHISSSAPWPQRAAAREETYRGDVLDRARLV